ncbi:hypothetical protein TRFO_20059 [Tritrichomonas foetus]|uniref:Uncharacterized protein n=1 Tax=Tritrichomonas foetus TaxID=1144522 RepID=A0A1J4KGS2_9EUKA|nr:hypothetical protein TRFO_20059 [Tritrichomonas foetus]|eukprot:OHT10569.1 hypothetical protein TRFO_20059 [Tritrichomonas foetus]
MEDRNDNKRYYPSPMEQSILVQSVGNYFSKPERSVERNKIAAEVSAALMKINNHWTHRAVRLWFNNNKHTYNGEGGQPTNPSNGGPPFPIQQHSMPQQHSVHFGEPPFIQQSQQQNIQQPMQQQVPQQQMNPISAHPISQSVIQQPINSALQGPIQSSIPSAIQPPLQQSLQQGISQPLQQSIQQPIQNIQSSLQPSLQTSLQTSLHSSIQPPLQSSLQPSIQQTLQQQQNQPISQIISSIPLQPSSIPPSMQIKPQSSQPQQQQPQSSQAQSKSNQGQSQQQQQIRQNWQTGNYQNFTNRIQGLIESSLKVDDENMATLVQQYDQCLSEMRSVGQTTSHSYAIDPKNSITFPQPDPTEFSFSSSLSVQDALFQSRRYTDVFINSQFDAAFVDGSCAAFHHIARFTPDRALSYEFVDSPKFGESWKTQKVNTNARIESLVVDSDHKCVWMLGNCKVLRLHLDPNQKLQSTDLTPPNPSMYAAPLVVFNGRVVTGYSESNILYFIDNRMKVTQVNTGFSDNNGYSVISPMNDLLLCGLSHSAAVRLINENGAEVRSFVGHTDTPIYISKMSNNTFLTASDDRSLKIWDIRQHAPIGHIGTNRKSITAISGCENYAVFTTHPNQICVVDVRGVPIKPIIGVSTDEYGTSNLYYNPVNDTLCLFGVAAKEGNSDSLLFIDDEGASRKYVFRRYQNFIHL